MHELSIASALVEETLKIADQQEAGRVCGITVSIGVLSGVECEALSFCFPMVAEGTALEGARLTLEIKLLQIICNDCGKESTLQEITFSCLHCASNKIKILAGKEILITSLELEDNV